MKKDFKDSVLFSDSKEFNNRSDVQEVLFDVINLVNRRISKFYRTPESKQSDVRPLEMLFMVTGNIFANLAHNLMISSDSSTKIAAFNTINEELYLLNKHLFTTLETYYNADERHIN